MVLFLQLRLGIGREPLYAGLAQPVLGECSMGDWIRDLADEYKLKARDKHVRDAAFLKTEELLDRDAPRRWEELRSLFKAKCEAFNKHIGNEALSWVEIHPDKLTIVRRLDNARLEGEYDSKMRHVEFRRDELPPVTEAFTLAWVDGATCFTTPHQTEHGVVTWSTDNIAQKVLGDFLRG
jgi:hypothetical protein